MNNGAFAALVALLSAATFATVFSLSGPAPAPAEAAAADEPPVYYPGCDTVRALGKAPLYRDQPGYRPEMDGDDDGVACEPHH